MRAPIATEGRELRAGSHESQCSFCLNDRENVESLVTAPQVSICAACVSACVGELTRRRIAGWRRWWDLRGPILAEPPRREVYRTADATCSFCGQDRPRDTLVAAYARICGPCVRLALDILRERAGTAGAQARR